MNRISTFSTSCPTTNRLSDWKSAAMGVEFLFIGGYRLGEPGKAIESHRNHASDRLVAEIQLDQLDQRSGGYSFRASVPI